MLRVFLNAKQPRAPYKSAKFFFSFLKLRRIANFGLLAGKAARFSRYKSFFTRMLFFRKFVLWFYGLRTNRRFRRLFQKFRRNSIALRYGMFLNFFSQLELLLGVVTYRLGFASSLALGIQLVRTGFIFVDGTQQRNTFFVVLFGSIVESLFMLTTKFWVLFLIARSSLVLFNHWVGQRRVVVALRIFKTKLWGRKNHRFLSSPLGAPGATSTPLLQLQRVF